MGIKAVELLEEGKGGLCVVQHGEEIESEPILTLFEHKRKVPQGMYDDVLKLR
jgi:6-phosphofructokinase 1